MIGIVTPRDLYSNRRKKQLKGAGPKAFYQSHHTGKRYDFLNSQLSQDKIPTPFDILVHQHDYLKSHYGSIRKEFSDVINILNNSKINGYALYDADIQETINNLERILGNWKDTYQNLNVDSLNSIIKKYEQNSYISERQYEILYTNFCFLFSELAKSNIIEKDLLREFKAAIKKLKTASNITIKNHPILGGEVEVRQFENPNILKSLAVLGKKVKTRFLELAVLKDIREMTKDINNLEVIDSAKILEAHLSSTGKISSKNKQSINDIKIFKTSNNTIISINDLINKLKNLDSKQKVETLKSHNIALLGVQAKSGYNTKPFNEASATLNEVIEMSKSKVLDLLYYLMYEPTSTNPDGNKPNLSFFKTDKNLPANKKIYEVLFNYNLAHNLSYILGYENAILATNDGLIFMEDYLYQQNQYIGASSSTAVNIANRHKKLKLVVKKVK